MRTAQRAVRSTAGEYDCTSDSDEDNELHCRDHSDTMPFDAGEGPRGDLMAINTGFSLDSCHSTKRGPSDNSLPLEGTSGTKS